ncbi:MAG: hypothetical protein Kow00121_26300 [Elainellaceae cyanobacterium]
MVDPIDDIARQARQGSVAAIIQVLNEKLADSGVRTRAVLEQGVLQLLCEAAKPEQLEQSVLVPQVRQILESLQPNRIRRVHINSRIVREQQLLWLDEIHRDQGMQLLWSEEIVLKKPNIIQQVFRSPKIRKPIDPQEGLSKLAPSRLGREKQVFWRGLVGGASLSIFLLLVGWAVYHWLDQSAGQRQTATSDSSNAAESPNSPTSTDDALVGASDAATSAAPELGIAGAFEQAVNLAESTASAGQTAQTPAEWLTLAAQWQQASDLMGQVSPDDARYATAQSRVELYRQNSEAALERAQQIREGQ